MAVIYSSSGSGSDFHILGVGIGEYNRQRRLLHDTSTGYSGKTYADFKTNFLAGSPTQDDLDELSDITERDLQPFKALVSVALNDARDRVNSWITRNISKQLNSRVVDPLVVLEDLVADMRTNSKSVLESTGSIAEVGTHIHLFHSDIHAKATHMNSGTLVSVEFFTQLASTETLTFEIDSPQDSGGVSSFLVYGEEESDNDDERSGWGDLGSLSTYAWDDFGAFSSGSFEDTGDTGEFASGWRGFLAHPFTAAPNSTLFVRGTTAATVYRGDAYAQITGDGAATDMYIARVVSNPQLDLNTTAWGTSANDSAEVNIASSDELGVFFMTFRYREVPASHTLTCFLSKDGSEVAPDQTVRAVTADGSSTWRTSVAVFVIDQGDTVEQIIGGLKLRKGGAAIPVTTIVKVDDIKLVKGLRVGNFWFIGLPDVSPLGRGQEETYTLTRSTEGKWQGYFTEVQSDEFGQRFQLPSVSSLQTEAETLIAFSPF